MSLWLALTPVLAPVGQCRVALAASSGALLLECFLYSRGSAPSYLCSPRVQQLVALSISHPHLLNKNWGSGK